MIKLNLKNYLKVKAFEWCEDKAFIVFIQMLRNAKIMIDVMFHEEKKPCEKENEWKQLFSDLIFKNIYIFRYIFTEKSKLNF